MPFLILTSTGLTNLRAESETIDLKALAKRARPAVLLLVVSDAAGKEIATGTGFLVSSDGKLITNHHVIEKAASAVGKAENGGLFPVEGILADDPKNDLVLLKLKGKDLPFLTLSSSDKIEVGARVAVIGSPLGLEGTLSEGIVSAMRDLMGEIPVVQITAAISPGSSGSPVLDAKGEVIGVASSLIHSGQSLNFAVPVKCAIRLSAKINPSSKPQPLAESTAAEKDKIYADPDWRAIMLKAPESRDDIETLKHAKALVSRYPENSEVYRLLGYAFDVLDFTEDAFTAYQQAIKLDPENAAAWWNLGQCYSRFDRWDDAIAAYQRAIKINPDLGSAWCSLGIKYVLKGRYDDAITALRQGTKLRPDNFIAWDFLGIAYEKTGRTNEAREAHRRSEEIRSKTTKTLPDPK